MRKSLASCVRASVFVCTVAFSAASPAHADAALPIDVYAAAPNASSVTLSPDGSHIAMVQPLSGVATVVVYSTAGNGHCSFVPEDVTATGVRWAGPEHVFVDILGKSRWHGYVPWEATEKPIPVRFRSGEYLSRRWAGSILIKSDCTNPKMMSGAELGEFLGSVPNDERHFFVGLGTRLGYVLYNVDAETGLPTIVHTYGLETLESPSTSELLLDQTGTVRVRIGTVAAKQPERPRDFDFVILAQLAGSKDWQEVYRYHSRPFVRDERELDVAGFGDDPNVVYGVSRNGGDHWTAYPLDLRTKQLGAPLFPDEKFDAAGFFFEPTTNRVVGVEFKTPAGTKVDWLDRGWQQIYADLQATFEGEEVVITSATRDRKKLTVLVTGSANPAGDYYLVDLSLPQATKIGSAYPAITSGVNAPPKVIAYKARDGLAMPAYLTLPAGSAPKAMPLVVLPHGAPRDEPGFDWLSEFLASRGYAVLQPEYRGSEGFGRVFADAGRNQWGAATQNDISDGVKFLVDQGIADPKRLAILGWSFGGYSAMAGLAFTPDLYRCGVSISGYSDVMAMASYQQYAPFQQSSQFAWPSDWWPRLTDHDAWSGPRLSNAVDEERLHAVSPVLHAERIVAPLLLIHAKGDKLVPIAQSEEMADALKKRGKPYDFVALDSEDHALDDPATRKAVLQAVEPFLAKCMK